MESLVDDNVLAQALPALLMAGGVAAAVVMQCGKSRTVKQKKRPGKGGSRKSRKGSRKGSRKVSKKSGKSKRESKKHGHKVSKSSKSGTSKRSSKSGKSKKSSKSKKSYKSGSRKVVSAKPVPKRSRRSSKSKSQSRSKTSDDASSQARKSKTTKTAKPVRVVQQQAAAPKVDLAAPKVDHAAQQRRQHEENQKAIARAEEVRAAACVAAQRDVQIKQPADINKRVRVEPQELRFGQSGGLLKVRVFNPTDNLLAIKVKCSDNNLYRVNPVYSLIQPNSESEIDVVRQNGSSKVDKLVFVFSKVDEKTDPKNAFSAQGTNYPMIVLPLLG